MIRLLKLPEKLTTRSLCIGIGWKVCFPELKESEDEKVKKELITFFESYPHGSISDTGTNVKEIIAWLKKQGKKENLEAVNLDYIKDELDKIVKIYKPEGNFGWGTLYNIATHFFELGIRARKENKYESKQSTRKNIY